MVSSYLHHLENIPADTYSFWAFPGPRFGHFTSNVVESLNGAWQKSIRHLPPRRMMAEIWAYIMEHFAERMIRQQEDPAIQMKPRKAIYEDMMIHDDGEFLPQRNNKSRSKTGKGVSTWLILRLENAHVICGKSISLLVLMLLLDQDI